MHSIQIIEYVHGCNNNNYGIASISVFPTNIIVTKGIIQFSVDNFPYGILIPLDDDAVTCGTQLDALAIRPYSSNNHYL